MDENAGFNGARLKALGDVQFNGQHKEWCERDGEHGSIGIPFLMLQDSRTQTAQYGEDDRQWRCKDNADCAFNMNEGCDGPG